MSIAQAKSKDLYFTGVSRFMLHNGQEPPFGSCIVDRFRGIGARREFLKQGDQHYSVRKASKGSRRAAFTAGATPAAMPMSNETIKAMAIYAQAICTGKAGSAVSRI